MKYLILFIAFILTHQSNFMMLPQSSSGHNSVSRLSTLQATVAQYIIDNNNNREQLSKCSGVLKTYTQVPLNPVIEELQQSMQKLESQNSVLASLLQETASIQTTAKNPPTAAQQVSAPVAQYLCSQCKKRKRSQVVAPKPAAPKSVAQWNIQTTTPEQLKAKYSKNENLS